MLSFVIQNYGAFYEKDGAGFKGQIKLTGFVNGDIDLSDSLWTYQVYFFIILPYPLYFGFNMDSDNVSNYAASLLGCGQ